jgi:hypothetical protein
MRKVVYNPNVQRRERSKAATAPNPSANPLRVETAPFSGVLVGVV